MVTFESDLIFNAPRVGNGHLQHHLKSSVPRVGNGHDLPSAIIINNLSRVLAMDMINAPRVGNGLHLQHLRYTVPRVGNGQDLLSQIKMDNYLQTS